MKIVRYYNFQILITFQDRILKQFLPKFKLQFRKWGDIIIAMSKAVKKMEYS